MSEENEADAPSSCCCCASCGIAEIDEIKLKECGDCDLVRYCSDECQQEHKSKHEEACQKRAAELRDEVLFKQPESSHLGDCPICCLPLSLEQRKSSMYSCCSKLICRGCEYANKMREKKGRLERKCPFCRHPTPRSVEEIKMNHMKRIEVNDAYAMFQMAMMYYKEGDCDKAFSYFTKAAGLGNIAAHDQLSQLHHKGHGVERDEKKAIYHLEVAAISGHPQARNNLASIEERRGRRDRAVKHLIIAAKQGFGVSLDALKTLYKAGYVSKEDFATALRAHHAAVKASKSPQRELAEKNLAKLSRNI